MTYDDIVDSINHGEKIYNIPLRVTFYCRVSTDSDVQLNSLDNQVDYYRNYIMSKEKWEFVDGYLEEGVTGVRVNKRLSFQKMISDAKKKKFDLIVTKEASRFARDLEDSIHYIRILKEYGVGVFFENQNLNTFDPNSELILNIMFNIAQDESKKLSARVKFGHKEAIKKGHVLGSSNILGYRKDKCKLVIVEDEAKFIEKVFLLYATDKYGLGSLSKKLALLGYYNKNGKLYDKDTLKRIIENPKYKGYYRGHTYEIMDYRTKRRNKISKDNQVIHKCIDGSIPKIVSEKLWDKANEILEKRSSKFKNKESSTLKLMYSYSSKLICKKCNTFFQRVKGRSTSNNPTWSCSNYLKWGLNSCTSAIVNEKDLDFIFKEIFKIFMEDKDYIIDDIVNLYKDMNILSNFNTQLTIIDKSIEEIEKKKKIAFDMVYKNEIDKEELSYIFKNYKKEIDKLKKRKEEIIANISDISKSFNSVKVMLDFQENSFIESEFIREFLDKVVVSSKDENRNNIKLEIYLNVSCKDSYVLFMKDREYSRVYKKKLKRYFYFVYVR